MTAQIGRAYSLLTLKAAVEADGRRILTGMATTPSVDRVGDTINPLGVKFAASMPFLWQHRHDQPIGWVKFGKPTKDGIPFEAEVAVVDEPGTLKDRVDEAWQSIKLKLVRAVSIGFRPLKWAWIGEYDGIDYQEIECFELSAVTIPANADAVIAQVSGAKDAAAALAVLKTFDPDAPASSGRPAPPIGAAPGATGKTLAVKAIPKTAPKEGTMKKTIPEQISDFMNTRNVKSARMVEIMDAASDEGATLDEAQSEEYDTLEAEVKSLDDHVARLKRAEAIKVADATPIIRAVDQDSGSALRAAYGSVQIKPKVDKGIPFVRLLGAKFLAMQHHCAPWDIAKRWTDTPEVEMILRAAVTPGSTTDSTFAEPLVQLNTMTGDFIELLRAKEIIGRIQGFDRVPFNIKVPRGTADPTAYWVGQGDVKPLSRPSFDSVSLTFAKVAGIVPMTEELMKLSNPSAELKVRDGLIAALASLTDRDFLDPTKSASTGISPASVTNGVTPTTASGTTADALRLDLADMLGNFADANEDPTGITIIMTPNQALNIGLMRNSLGQKEFPDITMAGGVLEGFPVITSTNMAATGGSPTDGYSIVAVNAPNVYLAEEGLEVDISREASLQMQDSPDSPETAATVLVSLWQRNMVAIKAERYVTWTKKHATSVQFIQNAKYVA